MLLHSLVRALACGLVLEALAGPLSQEYTVEARTRRHVPSSHSLHERHLPHWSEHWTKRSKVPGTAILPMRIGIKQYNIEAGHDKLMDISAPGSANYGKHMTAQEVIDFFAPPPSSTDPVIEWLVGSGISADRVAISTNKQWIQFDATAAEVEDLLFAEFFVWEHISGIQDISSEEYHLPTHVREHIDYVTPGTRLRQRNASATRTKELQKRTGERPLLTLLPGFPNPNASNCDVYVTAECTRVQYSIPSAKRATPGNELGIFEGVDDHYSRIDLDVFFSTLYPNIPKGTYPEERLIDGAIGAAEDTSASVPTGFESTLDFQAAWPLIYPQKTVLFQEDDEFYETGEEESNGFFNTFLDAIDGSYCSYSAFGETGDCTDPECLDPVYPDPNPGGYQGQLQCGVYEPTNVISFSYGSSEAYLPSFYYQRQCNEFMKLALQGTTLLFASGDSGVGDACNGPSGIDSGNIFEAQFPSTCPYVLSVGSTEWDRFDASTPPTPGQKLNEVATRRFASSGGFSNVFPAPRYQQEAVSAYFEQVGPSLSFDAYDQFVYGSNFSAITNGVYHRGGRAFPDVAALGDRQVIYLNGSWYLIGGTSLATPVWASVLNLVNEERLAAGKSTVGFVNPVFYAHPEAFNDITNGSNPGCNSTGFPASKGWDPVTGLGSPNFPVLLEVLMGL